MPGMPGQSMPMNGPMGGPPMGGPPMGMMNGMMGMMPPGVGPAPGAVPPFMTQPPPWVKDSEFLIFFFFTKIVILCNPYPMNKNLLVFFFFLMINRVGNNFPMITTGTDNVTCSARYIAGIHEVIYSNPKHFLYKI